MVRFIRTEEGIHKRRDEIGDKAQKSFGGLLQFRIAEHPFTFMTSAAVGHMGEL